MSEIKSPEQFLKALVDEYGECLEDECCGCEFCKDDEGEISNDDRIALEAILAKKSIHIYDIVWETDEKIVYDLPQEMFVDGEDLDEIEEECIYDWMCDSVGWMVASFSWEVC